MRVDKFLKNSRLIKRRTVAKEACDQGRISINDKPAKAGTEVKVGDIIHREADRTVTVTFKEAVTPEKLIEGINMPVDIQKVDDKTFKVHIPATSFVILSF